MLHPVAVRAPSSFIPDGPLMTSYSWTSSGVWWGTERKGGHGHNGELRVVCTTTRPPPPDDNDGDNDNNDDNDDKDDSIQLRVGIAERG